MGVQQISLWESVYETFRPKKIRLYQFFAGIGAQAQAFKELGLDFEDYKIAEWSVPSIKAYNAIHKKDYTDYSQGKSRENMIQIVKNVSLDYNQPISEKQLNSKSDEWVRDVYNNIIATNNLVNICNVKGSDLEIDTSYTNIIFYSFPCQDLSKAGLRKGLNAERSGLLWEIERILKELTNEERESCVLICENVPDLVEVNFVKDFSKWVQQLENLGFTSYDQILNAKDYGVPQNRKRVFMVSLPGAYSYVFPRKMQLEYHLKDFLQEKPEEKYFLSQRIIDFFIANTEKQKLNGNGFTFDPMDEDDDERIGKTITTRAGSRMDDNFVKIKNCNSKGYALATDGDGIDISGRMQFHRGTVQKGCSQTLSTMGGNDVGVCVFSDIEKELFTEDGNIRRYIGSEKIDEFKEGQMATTTYPNGYGHGPRTHDESIALNTIDRPVVKQNLMIRKLTPTECMRLMGFDDDATNSMKEIGMTDSQIYHVAGDSIIVSVLMGIFGQLLGIDYEPKIRELTKRLAESK